VDFQRRLNIAPSVLSSRLARFTELDAREAVHFELPGGLGCAAG
jgi:hypothetical protein